MYIINIKKDTKEKRQNDWRITHMNYIKHFGEQSAEYLDFRPLYPDALYQYLSSITENHELAWDCGTGNGQAASKLANYFKKVIATDINQGQLDVAIKKNNISYYNCPAEQTIIENASVDLITIAQALHWFNLDAFYMEVRRVAKPNAIIAAWCYPLGKITNEIDILILKLDKDILGNHYWSPARKYVDKKYQTILFPFVKMNTPDFFIEKTLSFEQLIGYLNTWSAVKEYIKINQNNPIDLIYSELKKAWGDLDKSHTMRWSIHLLVARL